MDALDLRDLHRGEDHPGLDPPRRGDPAPHEVAVGGIGGRLLGPMPVQGLQCGCNGAGGRALAATVKLGGPEVPGRGVHVHEAAKAQRLGFEAHMVSEQVRADQGPLIVEVLLLSPGDGHERQRGQLATTQRRARQPALPEAFRREPTGRVVQRQTMSASGYTSLIACRTFSEPPD